MIAYLNYIQPIDVAKRIYYRKRVWCHGMPAVNLYGNNGELGRIVVDFGDEKLEWVVYIADREKVLDAVYMAINNFSDLIQEAYS